MRPAGLTAAIVLALSCSPVFAQGPFRIYAASKDSMINQTPLAVDGDGLIFSISNEPPALFQIVPDTSPGARGRLNDSLAVVGVTPQLHATYASTGRIHLTPGAIYANDDYGGWGINAAAGSTAAAATLQTPFPLLACPSVAYTEDGQIGLGLPYVVMADIRSPGYLQLTLPPSGNMADCSSFTGELVF